MIDTTHDLESMNPSLETRHCDTCNCDTTHKIGIQEITEETEKFIYSRKHEYTHCCVCANTAVTRLARAIMPK